MSRAELPIFVGNFRSGTTLLANLLSHHHALASWYETKGLCEALRWLRVLQDSSVTQAEENLIYPSWIPGFDVNSVFARISEDFKVSHARINGQLPSGKAHHEYYPEGNDCIAYSLSEAELALDDWYSHVKSMNDINKIQLATGSLITCLGNLHASKIGKLLWINKTPEIPRFTAELRQCLGSCRVILMIRDGRDVVYSADRLGWAEPRIIADWWKGMILETRRAALNDPDLYLEVKYEDLTNDPVRVLNKILEFIGVEQIAGMLVDHYLKSLAGLGYKPDFYNISSGTNSKSRSIRDTDRFVDSELLSLLGYL